ncbi:TMEM175 family protein [Streptococcus sp. DD12]|uniref:TMEM175 family protein n=1 Tax=Streptococcus sp. DD12 TaxID=1777880 RepID=UPI0007922BC0|nr:TMEM175 family protein [Streptococcus sp. DD12]KXT77029.1 Integral membrane protein [Streptococcus sp. DD12]
MEKQLQIMGKERLGAFIDAVLAIVMTLLVLTLDKPKTYDWQGLWGLRISFLAYSLTFFRLGMLWVNIHFFYHLIKQVSQKTVWSTLVMLFFTSFFPYTTQLLATHFHNGVMQAFYGIIFLGINLSVLWYFRTLDEVNENAKLHELTKRRNQWMAWDIAIKVVGLLLSLTVFSEGVILSDMIALIVIVVPRQLKH